MLNYTMTIHFKTIKLSNLVILLLFMFCVSEVIASDSESQNTVPCYIGHVTLNRPTKSELIEFLKSNAGNTVYLNLLLEGSIWGTKTIGAILKCNSRFYEISSWIPHINQTIIRPITHEGVCSKDVIQFSNSSVYNYKEGPEERLYQFSGYYQINIELEDDFSRIILEQIVERDLRFPPTNRFLRMESEEFVVGECAMYSDQE